MMRKRHFLFFGLLCAAFAAFAQKNSCCTKNYETASYRICFGPDSLHRQGEYLASIEWLSNDTIAKDYLRYYQIAADWIMLGQTDSAIKYLNRFIDCSPDDRMIFADKRWVTLSSDSVKWTPIVKRVEEAYFACLDSITHKELALELFYLGIEDQKSRVYRGVLMQFPDSSEYPALDKEMYALFARTKKIYDIYGFPTISMVGKCASTSAFLLLQHSPYIRKYYKLIRQAYQNGEIDPVQYAMVTDRLLTEDGKPQLYGTQAIKSYRTEKYFPDQYIIWPIKDFANVNKKRAEMGFSQTVEENAKRLGAIIPEEYYAGKVPMRYVGRDRVRYRWKGMGF
ncbi:MAG: hypothetical protein IJR53_06395 [Bacteroidales bacterium]|nr:hypothetical protein [Bacteroidales bacterium]